MERRTIQMLLTFLAISACMLACQFFSVGGQKPETGEINPMEEGSTETEPQKTDGILQPLKEFFGGESGPSLSDVNIGGTVPMGFTLVDQLGGSTKAVVARGDRVYIGQGPRVVALDVSDPQKPRVLGESKVLPGLVTGLALEDDTLYASAMYGGLHVLDVHDPAKITVTGTATPKTPGCDSLAIRDKKAYMACNPGGLFIADISNSKNPELLYTPDKPTGASISIALVGDYAYIANVTDYTLDIFNIQDPRNPEKVGAYSLLLLPEPEYTSGIISSVRECGGHLCLAAGQDGLIIMDVTDPINPSVAGWLDTAPTSGLVVDGTMVYLADDMEGIHVIDISDHKNPREVGLIPTRIGGWELSVNEVVERGLFIDEDKLYITDQTYGLTIADVGNINGLQRIGHYMTPVPATLFEIRLDKNIAYIIGDWSGFRVVDVSDPENMRELAYDDERKNVSIPTPRGLVVREGYAYIADANYPLHIFSIDDPSKPVQVGALFDPAAPDGAYDIVLNGDLAYMSYWDNKKDADSRNGIMVVDIKDASNPKALNFVDVPNDGWTLALAKEHLYMLDMNQDWRQKEKKEPISLRVFDIANPQNPSCVNTIELPGAQNLSPTDMVVDGERLYVRILPTGVLVYNLKDPSNPELETSIPFMGGMPDIMKAGKYLFLGGIMAYDISDFEKPEFAGQTGTLQAWDAVLDQDMYYVITSFQGLYLFKFDPLK